MTEAFDVIVDNETVGRVSYDILTDEIVGTIKGQEVTLKPVKDNVSIHGKVQRSVNKYVHNIQ